MARYWFGAGIADWTMTTQDAVDLRDDMVQTVAGVAVTVWNAETGGTQLTDLLDSSGGAVSQVTSSDGSDGRAPGTIPPFQGPEGVTEVWASANGGPRQRMTGHLGAAVAEAVAAAVKASSDLASHIEARNPHATRSVNLVDYSDVTPADGQVAVWDADLGQYVPTTLGAGLNPADFVQTVGGSEIVIPVGDVTTRALGLRLPPGDRSAAANSLEARWNAGTEGSPNWFLATWLDGYGQLRGRATAANRVYGQVRQYGGAQTANLLEFTDAAGTTVLGAVGPAAQFRAPNIGISHTWHQDTGTVGVGTYRFYNPTGTALVLRGFVVSAGGTAPAGGDYIINPKLDGAAVYSSANRPKIVAGGRTSGVVTNLTTTNWPAGSYLTVDVDAVPTTAPTKVTIQVLAY